MADLVTHLAVGVLVKVAVGAASGRRRGLPAFLVGSVLPDAASRVPTIGMTWLLHRGLPIPEPLIYGFYVLHMPLGLLALCFLLAALFAERERSAAFADLLGGAALHFAVDLLQRHYGPGYMLLYPLSRFSWEARLIGSEDTVFVAPLLAAAAALAWALSWRCPRPAPPAGAPPGSSPGPGA